MNGTVAFQLESPDLNVSWGIRPADLEARFRGHAPAVELRRVRAGYYVAPCRALKGLRTMIGFHFRPLADEGVLNELEFYDNGSRDLEASFALYQLHLERTFGPPSRVSPGQFSAELPSYEWRIKRLRVSHWVMERFGPEEHVRILRRSVWAALWT